MVSSIPLAYMVAMCLAFASIVLSAHNRPSILNTKTKHNFHCRGHQSTFDGRIFVCTPFSRDLQTWHASVFRPESITYEVDGRPNLSEVFSTGKTFNNNATHMPKGNGFGLCIEDSSRPYTMLNDGKALYRYFLIDSPPTYSISRTLWRRVMTIEVSQPFTKQSDIHSFRVSTDIKQLLTSEGEPIIGFEPTLTADGRFMIIKHPDIPALMYTYNNDPCAVTGWSAPRPLNWLFYDPNPELSKYPLSWKPLLAADGMSYDPWRSTDDFRRPRSPLVLFGGAYPWIDHEGRNLVYVNGGDCIVNVIGADTKWTAYNVDGAVNGDRYDCDHKFLSGPMWRFEKERAPWMNYPRGQSNKASYLPVTKQHDVMPLFSSFSASYEEVDLASLSDEFHLLSLPMNEMVVYNANKYSSGVYDLAQTPDLSGHFFTGMLIGNCIISEKLEVTQAPDNSLLEPHGKGRAIIFQGDGVVRVQLSDKDRIVPGVSTPLGSLTIQFTLRPDYDVECTLDRYIIKKDDKIGITFNEITKQIHFYIEVNGQIVNLGYSPPLPLGKWSHVAYTWDGVAGRFREYINGISTDRELPRMPGTFILGEGNLYVGAADEIFDSVTNAGFRGAIDELAIFTHVRSARSICASAHGVNCQRKAIRGESSTRSFSLSAEAPACLGLEQINTAACQSAIHRGCAERGVSDALLSRSNLHGTISQLISDRPPVALAGVPVASTFDNLTVGCIPISHQSVAVEFDWLSQIDVSCVHEDSIMGMNCTSAIHQFCMSLGWSTGVMFELTSRPWVSCFNSGLQTQLYIPDLTGELLSPESRLEISQYCATEGYGAGLLQGRKENYAVVHCFRPSVVVTWPYIAENEVDSMTNPSAHSDGSGRSKELITTEALPLSECAGDCDEDDDCDPGLMCFQRDSGDERSIPGCSGIDLSSTDYCIKKELVDWWEYLRLYIT